MAAHHYFKKGQVVGGLYYMTTEGREAYVLGGGQGRVVYKYSDGGEHLETTEEVVKEWTPLDLVEFTGSEDHTLPYVFDLHWDCKTVQGMVSYIKHEGVDADDEEFIRKLLDDPNTFKDPRYHVTAEDIQKIRKALG